MRAYVSIRGSRGPRHVDRDASQVHRLHGRPGGPPEPYAALVLEGCRFELTYQPPARRGQPFTVQLHRQDPGSEAKRLLEDKVYIAV